MNLAEREKLYRDAWNHWGSQLQADILIEEMSELIHALLAARRNGTFYTYAVSEEMADVLICLEQFETRMRDFPTVDTRGGEAKIVGCVFDQVEQIRERKLVRLKSRLEESIREIEEHHIQEDQP